MTMGMIEELNESDARKLMDTNFFGALLGLSGSDAIWYGFWTYHTDYKHWRYYLGSDVTGIYGASKFALEGMK